MNPIEIERELFIETPSYQVWFVKDTETQEVIGFDEVDLEASR